MNEKIKNVLMNLPESSGCYIFRNKDGEVIYVGKAVSLKNRVRQYFHSTAHQIKVEAMVSHVDSIEYIVTDNETEALLLENNLIKRYMPHYNILLKNGNAYPYIELTLQDRYPQLKALRTIAPQKGNRYFGPYLGMTKARDVIDTAKMIYPIIQCKLSAKQIESGKVRPCINYQIGLCSAPCAGLISAEEYRQRYIEPVAKYLSGSIQEAVAYVESAMKKASAQMEFERAGYYRDLLTSIRASSERQKAVFPADIECDAVALLLHEDVAVASSFFVRKGRIIGRHIETWENRMNDDLPGLLSEYLKQYYFSDNYIPRGLILSVQPADADAIEETLLRLTGRHVEMTVPQRGKKKDLITLALKNAEEYITKSLEYKMAKERRIDAGLEELKRALSLPKMPLRIECFDISNIQGTDSVASMVVAINGYSANKEYRRYRIKTVEGANDFASMAEIMTRRFGRAKAENGVLPDLIVVDGGAIQLRFAHEVMKDLGYDIPMVGLAEKFEEIYRLNSDTPLILDRRSTALQILTRLRDEAHRFAITYHRSLRSKNEFRSRLLDIEGIGKKKSAALFKAFGSYRRISEADEAALAAVPGITQKDAEKIAAFFEREKTKGNA